MLLNKKLAFSLLLSFTLPLVPSIAVAENTDAAATEAVTPQTSAPASTSDVEPTAATTTPEPLPRRLVLSLKQRKVYVYEGDKAIADFRVAIGKPGWETPKGNFKVLQMTKDPVWQNPWNGKVTRPGPNSALGERWIGFWTDGKNTIGFHGTPGVHLLGRAVSHGCVRMSNADIKAMFELVDVGTPVIVQ